MPACCIVGARGHRIAGDGDFQVDGIKEFGVILGPLVPLVSAASGFYHGTKGS